MAQTIGMGRHRLHHILDTSVERWPERPAVEDSEGRQVSYRQLDQARRRIAQQLGDRGVGSGDRVGLCLPKSLHTIAALYGILQCDAGYVPVDVGAPVDRNAFILADCTVAAVIVTPELGEPLQAALANLDWYPPLLVLDSDDRTAQGTIGLDEILTSSPENALSRTHHAVQDTLQKVEDLAYILYTSGSTGRPKGVILSHRNADSFLTWCSRTFEPQPTDRFASHAPLYFDLSILDIHLPLRHGACIVLIDEATARDPLRLAPFIAEKQLTVWYSAPSTLAYLAQFGRLDQHDVSTLRAVLFAGEVFPIKHLRSLTEQLPNPRYFNLYGPTETNVCTFQEILLPIDEDRREPFPIGAPCNPFEVLLLDESEAVVEGPGRGELLVRGPAVTSGYWNLPKQNETAFWQLPGDDPTSWYRTGDLVHRDESDLYHFLGRRDRMVKRRGFRIELDEIEACLYGHHDIEEVAVIAHRLDDGVRIDALLCGRDGSSPSTLELRRFVHQHLPGYMCPDRFHIKGPLPRTATGKVNYQALQGDA